MEELELIEKYFKKELSEAERVAFENKMQNDQYFRERAESHLHLLNSFKIYGDRKTKKEALNRIHDEMNFALPPQAEHKVETWRNHWPTVAIAATVALLCTIGTFLVLQWNSNDHQANYLELRRSVETLKKSYKALEKNKENKKPVAPSTYSGSGFLISPNGYLVTSYHVINSADSVYIENEKFGRLKATLVYKNQQTDIAILLVDGEPFKDVPVPFIIRTSEGNLGEAVYTLGYPRDEVVYGDGTISATTGFEKNENSYQISIPVNPGNSGGPMIDQQGAVIGIINGVQTETRGTAFAVKSNVLLDEIKNIPQDSLLAPIKINTKNPLANLSRVNQIKRWKDFVFIVKVYNAK